MEQTINKLRFIRRMRMIFFMSVLLSIVAIIYFLPRIAVPLGISFILYLILHPLIPWMNKFKISNLWASTIIVALILFTVIYPMVISAPSIVKDIDTFHYYTPKITSYLNTNYYELKDTIKNRIGYEIQDDVVLESVEDGIESFKEAIVEVPQLLGNILEWIFVTPLFLFFMLKDSRSIRDGMLRIVPNAIFERYYNLTYQFNKKIGDYIFAKFIEAMIVGTLITVGLMFAGVRFSIIFGLIAAVTNIIPYVGPFLGAIPAILFGAVEYGTANSTFGAMVLIFVVANAIDLGLIFPILVSKLVDLHPAVVVTSVILGSQFMGMIGMIISIPLAAAVKLILIEIYSSLFSTGTR